MDSVSSVYLMLPLDQNWAVLVVHPVPVVNVSSVSDPYYRRKEINSNRDNKQLNHKDGNNLFGGKVFIPT